MENVNVKEYPSGKSRIFILDIIAVTAIFFTPAISHMLSLPIYLFEPMRIILVLAIVHTNKWNAYFLAFSLPLVSFLFSGHPVFPKVAIVAIELLFNVMLFYLIADKIRNSFFAMGLSIIISKAVYYILKFGLISFLLLDSTLISTPIYIQIIMTVLLGSYIFVIDKTGKAAYK
ncbi:hypothetical protein ACFLSQ_06285 [Bacteroidota bacterium]